MRKQLLSSSVFVYVWILAKTEGLNVWILANIIDLNVWILAFFAVNVLNII